MEINDIKKLKLKEGDYIKLFIDNYGEMFKFISKVQSYDNTNGIIVEEYSVCQTSTDKDIEGDITYGEEVDLKVIYDTLTISKADEGEIEYLEKIIKKDRFEEEDIRFQYNNYKFWDVIEKLKWREECQKGCNPFVRTRKRMLRLYSKDIIESVEKTAKAYRQVLMNKIQEYSLEKDGDRFSYPYISDDSFNDLTAHIVGCGQDAYNKAFYAPETIIEDYVSNGKYIENFEYTFNIN